MADPGLVLIAASFAVVTGINDGGSLLSTGLKLPSLRTLVAVALLAASVAAAPLLLGTRVAQTLTHRLVSFDGPHGHLALAVGVLAAVAVVGVLTRRGVPTSLTLALVGGLTGAGVGFGLHVGWAYVAFVLAVGMCAPLVGALVAFALSRATRLVPAGDPVSGSVARTHRLAFGLQCLAYSGNDGQKMLAVFAVTGLAGAVTHPGIPELALISLLFAVGVILGLPRVARSLGDGVLHVRPVHAVTAELASAVAVLSTAALGVPVSMTQSVAGGLVGAGMSHGLRRVRWAAASRIVSAWITTLPASVALAAIVALAFRGILS